MSISKLILPLWLNFLVLLRLWVSYPISNKATPSFHFQTIEGLFSSLGFRPSSWKNVYVSTSTEWLHFSFTWECSQLSEVLCTFKSVLSSFFVFVFQIDDFYLCALVYFWLFESSQVYLMDFKSQVLNSQTSNSFLLLFLLLALPPSLIFFSGVFPLLCCNFLFLSMMNAFSCVLKAFFVAALESLFTNLSLYIIWPLFKYTSRSHLHIKWFWSVFWIPWAVFMCFLDLAVFLMALMLCLGQQPV